VNLAFILAVGLVAGTLSGIVGFGSSIMLMPVLVIVYGPVKAVPIMAIAAIMANLSRVMAWWREVDWRACAAYSVTAIPGALLGARALLVLPPRLIEGGLGLFFIFMIPARRWLGSHRIKVRARHLAMMGFPIGFLTGVVVSTGPITTPIFLAYGLVKGAFLATEAASSLSMYISKVIVFRSFGALPWEILVDGLITGSSLMIGAFVAKRFVIKLDAAHFRLLMEVMMLISGLTMLGTALL